MTTFQTDSVLDLDGYRAEIARLQSLSFLHAKEIEKLQVICSDYSDDIIRRAKETESLKSQLFWIKDELARTENDLCHFVGKYLTAWGKLSGDDQLECLQIARSTRSKGDQT